jgi:hypothetical protein
MRTKAITLITCLGSFGSGVQAQDQRIVLQGNGQPQVFITIDDALAAAQPNDALYFSGGSFSTALASAGFTIGIPLHFIGAGIDPDSSGVTNTTTLGTAGTYSFTFTSGASGSTFTGIKFAPNSSLLYGTGEGDDAPQGMVFDRCEFDCIVQLGFDEDVPASSSTFTECIFRNSVYGVGPAPTTFTRCIFDLLSNNSVIGTFRPSGLTMDHCIVLEAPVANCESISITNSIFTKIGGVPISQSSGVVSNCMISHSELFVVGSAITSSNIITDLNPANIFVDEVDNDHQYSDDFRLAPGSPGIDAGSDGTDIGIYGSASPYKDGSIPFNLHFQQAAIANSTDVDGDLPVNIRVAAQPN